MIKTSISRIILIASLLMAGCSTFIPDEESDKISLKYQAGEYLLLSDVIRNDLIFPKNSVVKLIVLTGDDWVKVYAYNSSEELLASNRFIVLYLFDTDFPDEKFSQEYLDAELLKLVRPKNSAVQSEKVSKKEQKKDSKKVKK